MSKEKMVELCQGQLDAYNARDIGKFAEFYHAEVKAYRLLNNELIMSGIDELKVRYAKRFGDNPELFCELRSRVILDDTVLDEEWVTGVVNQERPSHIVAIYKFKDDLIHEIWFT
ncbi:MAG: nuclear transport factor 2 family protein [Rhizobacter sp.]|nr:nuclear transport factor 2 family protein [Bacteriovorax sp.]